MNQARSEIEIQRPLRAQLPTALTSFVGRKLEKAEVRRLLVSSRMLTLTGAAGCGKTRLAMAVAPEVHHQYADGVHWAELARLTDPALVPWAVSRALPIVEQPSRPTLEGLIEALHDKHLLLVLDNCEHVLSVCAQLVDSLLTAPDVCILATSREPLGVTGEMLYPLSPMALPSAGLPVDDLGQFDAIQLFVERAHAILPRLELTADNAGTVASICRQLDGIPLAIELASARVNVLSLEQIAMRLDDRFALLAPATHVTHTHHRTLHAAIDWSYDLLSAPEQVMLRRLSIFARGCSLAAAEAVCTGDGIEPGQTLDLIASLVNKSLVVAQTLLRGEARYSLLETIRQYGEEKLIDSDEPSVLRDRHLQYFVQLTEATAPKLIEPYQELWLSWLDGEYDNIRAALVWSLESNHVGAGLRIAIALFEFWQKHSYVQEGFTWFERLFVKSDAGVSLAVRANAFFHASFLAMVLGNTSATIDYGRKVIALGEIVGGEDKPMYVMTLIGLATSTRAAGDYATAFEIGERIIHLLRELGDQYRLGRLLIMQSGTAMALGRFDVVHALLDEALMLAREAGDSYRIALILNFLGDLARCEQDYSQAKTDYGNSIALFRELNAVRDLASSLHNLGHTCLHLGNVERARTLFSESMAAHQAQQNTPGMAECLIGFAAIAIVRGLHATGVRLLFAAITIGGPRAANVWTATQREYDHYLALARASLTATEFQAEEAAGRALSLEQALEYTRNLPLQVTQKIQKMLGDLTMREREIAALVAQGKSNGEIASELVVSKRTVEKHIANILSKLAFTTRAQIGRWAIETDLVKLTE